MRCSSSVKCKQREKGSLKTGDTFSGCLATHSNVKFSTNERVLGTAKQYNELMAYLAQDAAHEDPLHTSNIFWKIAGFLRMPTGFYSTDISFLNKIAAFSHRHSADEKVLFNCMRALTELGGLTTDAACKQYCFDYLKSLRNHPSKKIRHYVLLGECSYFWEFMRQEAGWFDYLYTFLSLPPKNQAFMAFSRIVCFEFDAFNNAQLAKIVQEYERFLQKTKNQFYQNWFGYIRCPTETAYGGRNRVTAQAAVSRRGYSRKRV